MAKKPNTPDAGLMSNLQFQTQLPVGPTGRFSSRWLPEARETSSRRLRTPHIAAASLRTQGLGSDIASPGGADALLIEHLSVAVVSGKDAEQIQSWKWFADGNNPSWP
jgi:hypothetical protein